MVNTPDNSVQTQNKQQSSNVEKTRFTISGQIIDIIDNQNGGDIEYITNETSKIERGIKKYMIHNFMSIENGEELSVFKKYYNWEKEPKTLNRCRIDKKFEKYFPIHFPIILGNIQGELENLEHRIPENLNTIQIESRKENIIKNVLKKYAYIIYILGEKIKVGELTKFLQVDLRAISSLYETVSQKVKKLDIAEEKNTQKIIKESQGENDEMTFIDQYLIEENIFATTYRNIFKKNISEGESITLISSLAGVSNEIEKLFRHEFEDIFIIFSKWCDSDGKIGDNLTNLEFVSKKLMYGVNIFKKNDIAFTNSFNGTPTKPYFIYDVNEVFIDMIEGSELKELFKQFIAVSLKSGGSNKYSELIKNISDFKQKTAESKIPDSLVRQENIDLAIVDFDIWDKVPEKQKYELMFSQIIGNNGELSVSDFLEIKEIDDDLVGLFTESYGIDFNIVKAQFEEIRSTQLISIRKFINTDINNLNLVIIWWRFLLKVRKLRKENGDAYLPKIDEINNIKENPYGVIEIISSRLKNIGILGSDKLTFKPEGKLNNISVETTNEQLRGVLRGLKKGPFDLLSTKIKTSDGLVLVKNLSDLYIPYKNTHSKGLDINEELENGNNRLNAGINMCFNILKKQRITNKTEKSYLKKVQKLGILPENLEDITIKDEESIQDLVETLKFIKNKRSKLLEMIEIGNRDKERLEGELSQLFDGSSEEELQSGFGPQKSYTRAFTKLIKLYSGDYTQIGDLTRLRIVKNSINELIDSVIQFISIANDNDNITHISIVDNIGEPISDAKKKSGYRDIKLLFTLKDGNVVELQFHHIDMLKLKEMGTNLYSNANWNIIIKMKKEEKMFTIEDMKELFHFAKTKHIKLPKKEVLEKLLLEGNINSLISEAQIEDDYFTIHNISSTYTYNISRQLDDDSNLKEKITKLERILSDNAWHKAVIDYLQDKGIQLT